MAPDLQVWAVSGLASCFLVCDFDLLQASENLNKDGPATPYGLIEADCSTRPVVLGMTEGPQGGRGSLPPVCADRPVRRPTFCTDSVTGPWGLSATANLWSAKVFNDPAHEEQQRLCCPHSRVHALPSRARACVWILHEFVHTRNSNLIQVPTDIYQNP